MLLTKRSAGRGNGQHMRNISTSNETTLARRVRIVKAFTDPAHFYHKTLTTARLRGEGWQDGGLCPFHEDRHSGSFRVHVSSGAFCCFACGAAGGDLIDFVMRLHGIEFCAALAVLEAEVCAR